MKTSPKSHALCALVLLLLLQSAFAAALDTVVFGNPSSESAHSMSGMGTETFAGALGESARRCLPLNPVDYYGGSITITMAVDPARRNYFTLKLWSDDDTAQDIGRLYLYIPVNGTDYQVGYRHEGDYMPLSVGNWRRGLPGRFFYSTTMLPLAMTQGRTSLELKVVSMGRLYGLGQGGEKDGGNYQFLMDMNSRGIYRAYTHVDAFLDPIGEVQGTKPATTLPASVGPEVFNAGGTLENNITSFVNELLGRTANSSYGTWDLAYLARSYSVSRISASYHNPAIVSKLVAVLDAYATAYYGGTFLAASGWGGECGGLGLALHHIAGAFTDQLDTVADYGAGGSKTRREAWGDMLAASRDYGRFNRRTLSNQNFIGDENVFFAERGLEAIGDPRAFSVSEGERYAREASGLEPWLGSDVSGGGHSYLYGENYYQVTAKGQTREWGYVGGNYGEMMPHVLGFYDVSGNPAFLNQAVKMSKARAPFRRPSVLVNGTNYYDHMEVIGLLAWRGAAESDGEFGDDTAYIGRDVLAELHLTARSLDPDLVGYLRQRIENNHFFGTYAEWNTRKNMLALDAFDDYAAFAAATDTGVRLPMSDGQPDFAWADEGNRILALKNGNDRLWITTYYQAKYGTGINGVARFQYDAENYTQYGVLETVPQFTYGGTYTRPLDGIDKPEGFQWWPPTDRPLNAYGNEVLPLGPTPPSAANSDPWRGKADFHAFRFGRYLVGINASEQKSFPLKTPAGFSSATDLMSGATLSGAVTVAPLSTVALRLPDTVDPAPLPGTPLYLNVAIGGPGVALSWTAASGAESYTVKRSNTPSGPYAVVASGITGTSHTDDTVITGRTYYYVVSAINPNGEGYPTCERSIVASKGQNFIGFNIQPSGNTAMVASDLAGAPGVRIANWNKFSGGTLSTGIVNGGGQPVAGMSVSLASSYGISDRGGATGNDPAMFRTVVDLQSGSSSTLTVTGIPFASYDVYFYVYPDENSSGANDRGGSFTVGGTTYYIRTGSGAPVPGSNGSGYIRSTSTTMDGMNTGLGNYVAFTNLSGNLTASMIARSFNGGTLRLKVSGFQIVNRGDQLPADQTAPSAPTGLSAAPVNGGVSLDWVDNTESDLAGYNVYRSTISGSGFASIATGVTASTFTDTSVNEDTTYYYVVTALDGTSNESPVSAEVSVTTGAKLAGAVIGTAGSWGNNSATTREAAFDGNLDTYFDAPDGSGYTAWVGLDLGTPHTISQIRYAPRSGYASRMAGGKFQGSNTVNFSSGVVDLYTVMSVPASGELTEVSIQETTGFRYVRYLTSPTQWCNVAEIVFVGYPAEVVAPAAPTGVAVTPGDGSVTVSWTASSGAESYSVLRATSPEGSYTIVATDITGTSYTDTGLAYGTAYYYAVVATNVSGSSPNSTQVNAITAPDAPTGLAATPDNAQVSLLWNSSTGAATYNVLRSTTSGSGYATVATGLTNTSYTDTGLTYGTTYYYVVTATNAGGTSGHSTEANATPVALPSPWLAQDIGAVAAFGTASYNAGTFTIEGSGANIDGSADEFHYVHQTASGDCDLIARVASIENTSANAKAGIAIRESTASGSRYAGVFLTPGGQARFQRRTSTNGSTSTSSTSGITAPRYLRLTRTGSTFRAYHSTNGVTWTQFGGNRTITMTTAVTIGLGVGSNVDGTLCTATFDNVTVTP